MSDIRTPGETGQPIDLSHSASITDILAELHALQRDIEQNLPRIQAAAARLEAKLLALDTTARAEGNPASQMPPFAFRCDGRLLICMNDSTDCDISEREIWTGVVLSPEEAAFVIARADDAAHDAAARLTARFAKKRREERCSHDS